MFVVMRKWVKEKANSEEQGNRKERDGWKDDNEAKGDGRKVKRAGVGWGVKVYTLF